MSQNCNNCGASSWAKLLERGYPERKNERDQTIEKVYRCKSCGEQGKHFTHTGGADIASGVLR